MASQMVAAVLVLVGGLLAVAPPVHAHGEEQRCPHSKGYWKSQPQAWPRDSLVLGSAANPAHTYSKSALLSLLGASTHWDGSLILASQLIAARLNVASGTNPAPIASRLATADALLGAFPGRLPYGVNSNSATRRAMVETADFLERYNTGQVPHSCGTPNRKPTAKAGPDQTVAVGTVVTLNGSASSDPDANPLTYRWSFLSKPSGSAAVLSAPTAVRPTFVADRAGTYKVKLIVNDGTVDSAYDSVRISTLNSPPTANAGPDQTVEVGDIVRLDGSASSDADGDCLDFNWSFVSRPAGSTASLSDACDVKPTFPVDVEGEYVVRLIVSDGHLSSTPDTVTISTGGGTEPLANAGPDQTAIVGATVTLDGSRSSDADGDPLTFLWSFTARPAGSGATLSDPTAVNPSFNVDVFGVYVVQLIVNDGAFDSRPDTVTIGANTAPTANAGPDQAAFAGDTVQLEGSRSTDVDGNPLTFSWSLTTLPVGSTATLSDRTAVNPTFVADATGIYIAQLIVNDGALDSLPDMVTVDVDTQNLPPVADAGSGQSVEVGATVQLDGSESSDPNGDPLTFRWSLLSRPPASTAALSDAAAPDPTFVADQPGTYVAQLIVNDGALDSPPASVTISTVNVIPVAKAGPDQSRPPGSTVQLDGSSSFDPDGTPLVFSWSILSKPAGSASALSNPAIANPTFVADREGVYLAQLIVSDGTLDSDPDTVAVTVQGNADLRIQFAGPPTTPAVGSFVGLFLTVTNLGPASITGATVSFRVPAGYTVESVSPSSGGSYDSATGTWTIGPIGPPFGAELRFGARVNATGPYDLVATITGSSQPDPNLANNTVTAVVTPDLNADLRISFNTFVIPSGTLAYGDRVAVPVSIVNDGPSGTTGVTARIPLPAGYTFEDATGTGTYDPATGNWTIGSMPSSTSGLPGGTAGIAIGARVNTAPGPLNLSATITASTAPDPNLANNTVTAPPANRPPIANAGPDQPVATGAPVVLAGGGSTDPDGDSFVLQWDFALRPASSTATLAGATTATPSFTPDRPGSYVLRLRLTDSKGAISAADTVTITAAGFSRAPIILSSPVTTGATGQPYLYDVEAIDQDAGDTLTFSLTSAPAGMTVDPATGVVQWTPADTQAGPQSVAVRVQDQHGLFAAQDFAVQVSSAANQAPVAADDTYEVRLGESLGVGAPGVLDNDTDADGDPLTATLLAQPSNGTVLLSSDGSFTFTPYALGEGDLVALESVNLATRVPGVLVEAPGQLGVGSSPPVPGHAADDDLGTPFQAHQLILSPDNTAATVVFPMDVTVTELQIFGYRDPALLTSRATAGFFQLFDASGAEIFNSGVVDLPLPDRDARQTVPRLAGVRRARFTVTTAESSGSPTGFADFKVIGSAVIRRQKVTEPNLGQLLPTVVQASSVTGFNLPEGAVDEHLFTNWYAATHAAGEFLELVFPVDVTVTQIVAHHPSLSPAGFGSSIGIDCNGSFTLVGGDDTVRFDSGAVHTPSGAVNGSLSFTLPVPSVAGVRRVRYTSAGCVGTQFPAGFSAFKVFGSAAVTTPAFSVARKLQGLVGREVHSTPLVVNLTDDTFDGVIDTRDVPDIVVPVESLGSQVKGEIKVISGDDGRVLLTMGGPDLVSPWAEAAVGDLDGDGRPDVVAVHSDGNHLIAFEATGEVKWTSDQNPMPRFEQGEGTLIGGAIALANLDAAGSPEIVVGASVFSAEGRLLGDGRTLGGTTGGTGLRSAVSAIADLDLDGIPEIVAGPTAYRLVGGALTIAWQRSGRPDGYVALGNFDDDPFPEIVVVASGQVYMLNHDGTDAEVWNPPSHGPVPIPGGGQGGAPTVADLDGDGVPEIGVAGERNYVVFNRDGSERWRSVIGDGSSHTGATVFDFDGDGSVEIAYRDELFLRVYRGSDGVLLAKTPIGSSTWAEQPVVADVDNDGHADLIVTSDLSGLNTSISNTGVHVFHDVANQWARTRRIWNQHSYHITNVNENGTIPLVETPNWLVPGLNNFRLNAFLPGETAEQSDGFTYRASDGTLASNVATVRIAIRAANSAPGFTSAPIVTAATGVLYTYAAQASDPDAGDILTFALPTAPAGMAIDPSSGVIQWTPTPAQLGPQDVVVKVADVRGSFALQGFAVQVGSPITVPDVIGQPQAAAQSAITSASLAVGSIATRTSATVPAGSVLSQSPGAGSLAAPGSPVSLVVSLGAPPLGTVPDVVGVSQASAQADIASAGFVTGAVTFQSSTSVPFGVVIGQSPAAGTVAESGSAVSLVVSLGPPPGHLDQDRDGFTPDQGDCDDTSAAIHPGAFDIPGNGIDENCNGQDSVPGDDTPPTAAIASPAEEAGVAVPTDIVGTATDVSFLRYTLELASVNETSFRLLASGAAPVVDGVLGRLDPTLLENGLYRVRLTAEDVNGQQSSAERVYRVTGEAKIGPLSLSFMDLTVPVSGIPITVIRSYDSRVKTRRDFGVGWSLKVKTGSYQNNRAPGDGWTITGSGGPFGLPCAVVAETRSHLTELRLSDRESYRFRPTLENIEVILGGCLATATFEFVDGTLPGATLEVLGPTQVLYAGGDAVTVFDGDEGTGVVFDPRQVRLTTIDGRIIDFDRVAGVTRTQDSQGNALRITAGGVVHSSGKSIAFTRDVEGRITRITDPTGRTLSYGYDTSGDLVEFRDQVANRTTFTYDPGHNLLGIDDPLGNRAFRGEYDADGRLIFMIDAKGRRIELSHDVAGREEVVTDARGNVSRLTYDDRGDVLSREQTATIEGTSTLVRTTFEHDALGNEVVVVDPDGLRTTATYEGQDLLSSVLDPAGLALTTTATYNSRRRLETRTDAAGGTSTFAYNSKGAPTLITDALGHATVIENDGKGHATRVVDPLGTVTRSSYDASGNLVREERLDAAGVVRARHDHTYDASGNHLTDTEYRTVGGALTGFTTTYAYDGRNRRVATTDPLGHVSRVEYNALGKEGARVDALGRRTVFTYDEVGALVRTDFPDGTFETRTYDGVGNLIAQTDRAARATTYEYDELNRLVRTVSPDGSSERTVYSRGGRVVARIDARGNRTDFTHDSAGRRIRTTLPEALDAVSGTLRRAEITEEWDGAGRLLATVDPKGGRTAHTYDPAGRRTRTMHPDGTTTEEDYDANGRVLERRDESGRVTRFEYDSLGRLAAVIDAAGGRTIYAHDEVGNLTRQTDAQGRVTRYAYDALGRMVEKVLPGGARETFSHDAVGNQISHRDFDGATITYQYDAMNRQVRRTFPDASTVTFTYTTTGRRATATDARGTTSYDYDANDRLLRVTHPTGAVVDAAYDASGLQRRLSSPAAEVSYEYDALNRLRLASTPSGPTAYGYDVAGNLVETTGPNGVVTRSTYDERDRLTEVRHAVGDTTLGRFTYQLSPTGRRLQVTEADGAVEAYTYDALDRLRTEVRTGATPRSLTHDYDAVGNRTRLVRDGSPTLFTYDVDDRLRAAGPTTFDYDGRGNLLTRSAGGSTITYTWDAEGRLVKAAGPAGATELRYDADGNRVERSVAGVTTRFLIDGSNPTRLPQVLEERDEAGNLSASYVYGHDQLTMTRGPVVAFPQHDGLGSTRLLADGTGAVTDTYAFEGYGGLAASTGSTNNPYLFTGEQLEPALGLYNLRARNYDPGEGRFLGRDPEPGFLGDPRSRHPFLYAHADPVNRVDPTGRFSMIEISVSLVTADSIVSTYSENLVTEVFFPVGRIAVCQLKPAFQLRDLGLLMIAEDVPGGHDVVDTAVSLIRKGTRGINDAGIAFAESLKVSILEVKLEGLLTTLLGFMGVDLNELLEEHSLDSRIRKMVEFKRTLSTFLNRYADALESIRTGNDDCRRWESVELVGQLAMGVGF